MIQTINTAPSNPENTHLLISQLNQNQQISIWSKKGIAYKTVAVVLGGGLFLGQEILFNEIAGIDSFNKSDRLSLIAITLSGAIVGGVSDCAFTKYPLKQRIALNLFTVSGVINVVQNAVATGCLFTSQYSNEAICQARTLPYLFAGTFAVIGRVVATPLSWLKKIKC